MRSTITIIATLLVAATSTGCFSNGIDCDPPLDMSDTVVETSTAGDVTYRVTVDGGPDNAGKVITLIGVDSDSASKAEGTTGTLDSEGKLTMRVTLPRTWSRAELEARVVDSKRDPCGTFIVNPDLVPAAATDDPVDPTPTPPTSTATPTPTTATPTEPSPSCAVHITKIETDREHFTGESDAIYRVHVGGGVPDDAIVRGTVAGTPVEGHVENGVAELRHRVHSYGEYTLTNIEITADGCTHDHDKDAEASATANVS